MFRKFLSKLSAYFFVHPDVLAEQPLPLSGDFRGHVLQRPAIAMVLFALPVSAALFIFMVFSSVPLAITIACAYMLMLHALSVEYTDWRRAVIKLASESETYRENGVLKWRHEPIPHFPRFKYMALIVMSSWLIFVRVGVVAIHWFDAPPAVADIPTPEVANHRNVEECGGDPSIGTECTVGNLEWTTPGRFICDAGMLRCDITAGVPAAEIISNGLIEDCNGADLTIAAVPRRHRVAVLGFESVIGEDALANEVSDALRYWFPQFGYWDVNPSHPTFAQLEIVLQCDRDSDCLTAIANALEVDTVIIGEIHFVPNDGHPIWLVVAERNDLSGFTQTYRLELSVNPSAQEIWDVGAALAEHLDSE